VIGEDVSQLPPDEGAGPPGRSTPAEPENGVDVPFAELPSEALENLIETFVLREGTDYGENEVPIDRKIQQVRIQLERGDVKIVFDLATETCSIVPSLTKMK
jgi:uncharacterized protein